MFGQPPLLSKSPPTHAEKYWLLAVVLLVVGGHAVVTYSLLPTLVTFVHIMLITSMFTQCLTIMKLGITLGAEEKGLRTVLRGSATISRW